MSIELYKRNNLTKFLDTHGYEVNSTNIKLVETLYNEIIRSVAGCALLGNQAIDVFKLLKERYED